MKFLSSAQSQSGTNGYTEPLRYSLITEPDEQPLAQLKHTGSITDRLLAGEKTAVRDCVNKYGGMIWTLARKFTATDEAAERATEHIFADIWKWAAAGRMSDLAEKYIIIQIAAKHLALHRMLSGGTF